MRKTAVLDMDGLQAICLSGELTFPDSVREVFVLKDGPRRVIVPSDAVWDDFFDASGVDIGGSSQP